MLQIFKWFNGSTDGRDDGEREHDGAGEVRPRIGLGREDAVADRVHRLRARLLDRRQDLQWIV